MTTSETNSDEVTLHDVRRERCKVTYDAFPALVDRIEQVAQELGCSRSDVAMHLLCAGFELYYAQALDLAKGRTPTPKSPRYAFKLRPPALPEAPAHLIDDIPF